MLRDVAIDTYLTNLFDQYVQIILWHNLLFLGKKRVCVVLSIDTYLFDQCVEMDRYNRLLLAEQCVSDYANRCPLPPTHGGQNVPIDVYRKQQYPSYWNRNLSRLPVDLKKIIVEGVSHEHK